MYSIDNFIKKTRRDNILKLYLLGFTYYFLNISSISLALYSGVIAALFIASVNGNYSNGINPFKQEFAWLTEGKNYVILTAFITACTSIITSLLSFFVVNVSFKEQKSIYQKLKLEYLIFEDKSLYYEELNQQEAEYLFYKRIFFILKNEKYDRENLIPNNKGA